MILGAIVVVGIIALCYQELDVKGKEAMASSGIQEEHLGTNSSSWSLIERSGTLPKLEERENDRGSSNSSSAEAKPTQ